MKLKILLINAPISLSQEKNTIEKLHNVSPPLGLAYLASMVKDLEVDVRILDAHLFNMNRRDIKRNIEKLEAEVQSTHQK